MSEASIQASKHPSLLEKLSYISRDLGDMKKDGKNAFHNYKYVKGEDAMSAFRVHEVEHRIKVFPKIDYSTLRMQDLKTKSGGTECLCTALVNFSIHDLDSSEVIEVGIPAQGADAADKAIYKLMTGAFKYFILQVFSASSDDPEDGKTDKDRGPQPKNQSSSASKNSVPLPKPTPKEVKPTTEVDFGAFRVSSYNEKKYIWTKENEMWSKEVLQKRGYKEKNGSWYKEHTEQDQHLLRATMLEFEVAQQPKKAVNEVPF